MNTIYEAERFNGQHALVPTSDIKRLVRMVTSPLRKRRNTMNALAKELATYLYMKGFARLTEIKYDGEGNQRRILVAAAR